MSDQNKVDLGPAELYVKWVSFVKLAQNISLEGSNEEREVSYKLVAIPLPVTEPKGPDEWLLICDRQALAETIRTRLSGKPVSLHKAGIRNPAIIVRTGNQSEDGDFSEISLVAALMSAGFHNITESERPWAQFKRKDSA